MSLLPLKLYIYAPFFLTFFLFLDNWQLTMWLTWIRRVNLKVCIIRTVEGSTATNPHVRAGWGNMNAESEGDQHLGEWVWRRLPYHLVRYLQAEDALYKICCSATKLLTATIGTRPEPLIHTHKDIPPVLISCLGEFVAEQAFERSAERVKLETKVTVRFLFRFPWPYVW